MNKSEIDIKLVVPDPDQPRKVFNSTEMHDLKCSIEKQGILSPLVVESKYEGDKYLLLDGERRYRCATDL